LGSIGFQMSIFYLVNWPDEDIKRETWKVISACISIFVAVLLFQGFNQVVEEYIIEGGGEMWEVFVDVSQLLFWLSCMQVTLAITSGAVNELWGGTPPSMEKIEVNVKSLAVLLAHVTGFSSINAFGSVQQTFFSDDPVLAFMIVPAGFFSLFALYHGFDILRDYVSEADDGEVDEYEAKWDEETEEAENDVAGLSLAFLTVQAFRFSISGVLPNVEGIESPETAGTHGPVQWLCLWVCGIACGILGILCIQYKKFIPHPSARVERMTKIVRNYFMFASSWSFFYTAKWAFTHTKLGEQESMLHVVLALVVTAVVFVNIFVIDYILDNDLFGQSEEEEDEAESALDEVILALSVLVGFSWEQSFDTAVSVLASSLSGEVPQAFVKLAMSLVLVAIVFPAWRFYILPKELELTSEMSDQGQKLKRLKTHAQGHYHLMVNPETEDHHLDKAHLKMKQERLQYMGLHNSPEPKGLIHVQVTAKGVQIQDRSAVQEPKKQKTKHLQKAATVNLLD